MTCKHYAIVTGNNQPIIKQCQVNKAWSGIFYQCDDDVVAKRYCAMYKKYKEKK